MEAFETIQATESTEAIGAIGIVDANNSLSHVHSVYLLLVVI